MNAPVEVEFWEGQAIELQTDDGAIYQTQIISIKDGYFHIKRPVNQQQMPMPIEHNAMILIYFYDHIHGLCKCRSRLSMSQSHFAVVAPDEQNIQKVQRRRFLRVPIYSDLVLHIESTPENDKVSLPCKTIDISGGGLSVACDSQIGPGTRVNGSINLRTDRSLKKIPFEASVVNCRKTDTHQYKISMEFQQMKESLRSEIIKFCLYRQIELRNKLRNYPV